MNRRTRLRPRANSDIEPQSKRTARLCAERPRMAFDGKAFCFSGISSESIAEIVLAMGAFVHDDVTRKTDYLVVGSKDSRIWKHCSYGRKIERAMRLKQNGGGIKIVREADFWTAVGE